MFINKNAGHLQDWITQVWVKATGQRFDPKSANWLVGPIGDTDIIKDQFLKNIAQNEGLDIYEDIVDTGLLETFDDLS